MQLLALCPSCLLRERNRKSWTLHRHACANVSGGSWDACNRGGALSIITIMYNNTALVRCAHVSVLLQRCVLENRMHGRSSDVVPPEGTAHMLCQHCIGWSSEGVLVSIANLAMSCRMHSVHDACASIWAFVHMHRRRCIGTKDAATPSFQKCCRIILAQSCSL
jgi:hypothetical protein